MNRRNPAEENSSLRRLVSLLRPYRLRLALAVLLLGLLAGVNMLIPLFIKFLLDDVFPNKQWKSLALILGGILVVYLARNLLYFFSKYTAVAVGEHMCFTVRNRLFEHLQHLNLRFYQKNKPGQISSRVMDDTFVVQTFIQDELPKLIQASFLFLGLLAVLYGVNWQLALAATVVLPLHLATFHYFKRPIKESSHIAQQHISMVQGNLIEKFLGMEVVKGFTAEQREGAAFEQAIDESRQSQLRSKIYHVIQKIVADLLVGLGLIALLGFGAFQVIEDGMSMGMFVAFFSFVGMLYPTVLELMSGFAKLTKVTACTDRVFEMLVQGEPEQSEHPVSRFKPIRGHLRFEGVCFRYGDGPPVLKNIGFEVKPGQVCVIVGPSGSGKSTLVKLMPRFLEPDLGRIILDGVDVRHIAPQHLRSAIGMTFQESFLFNSSIRENLHYARPQATPRQIADVARRTGAHDFIVKLAQGYETVIGENGVILSHGEKQRVALSRAMLKNPKILILDEATASIDMVAESHIIQEILDFMKGKTTLLITHRPELLQHADVVIKIEHGRVVYQGSLEGLGDEFLLFDPSSTGVSSQASSSASLRQRGGEATAWSSMKHLLLSAMLGLGALGLGAASSASGEGEKAALVKQEPVQGPATEAAAPSAFGKFIAQPGLGAAEIRELFDVVTARAAAEVGYRIAKPATAALLPAVPAGVRILDVLERHDGDAKVIHLIQAGFRSYKTQPLHLWLFGQTFTGNKPLLAVNRDLATIEKFLRDARKTRDDKMRSISASDLAHKRIKLNYVDPKRCLKILTTFGYTVVDAGDPVQPDVLPVIIEMEPTSDHNLVGAKPDFPHTVADPINELLVFYHPARPEQFSKILDTIRTVIDVAARQIVIEAMVLEISHVGLKRLGVEWELASPSQHIDALSIGRLPAFAIQANDEIPTFDVAFKNVFGKFTAKIRALIREGEAEILSRPSVSTLDNRMARINVGQQIPVIKSISNLKDSTVLVSFDKVLTGITLNVRPRLSTEDEQISMQVLASVKARIPNQDVIATDINGNEVARAPTISERKIQTYTRIPNNTPFIIGGLISRDDLIDRNKIPLLGDLPIIGPAVFQSKRVNRLRREVIIVITPRILPEHTVLSPALPGDRDAFDSFGHQLFRNAYRIRAEDVFDLTFLLDNQQLRKMQRLADMIVRQNVELETQYPFDQFSRGRLPGERILVYRQMYEVIKRRGIDTAVDPGRIIFFQPDPVSHTGFRPKSLMELLAELAPLPKKMRQGDPRGIFASLADKAVALTYTFQSYNETPGDIMNQPMPEVNLVDCLGDTAWSRILWELNQPDREGRRRFTILLRHEKDLARLRRAIVLKQIVQLNANRAGLTLKNFSIGRLLLMPTIKEDQTYLIDEETAKYFFYTEQYYPAMRLALTKGLQAMRGALSLPEIRKYLPEDEAVRALRPVE